MCVCKCITYTNKYKAPHSITASLNGQYQPITINIPIYYIISPIIMHSTRQQIIMIRALIHHNLIFTNKITTYTFRYDAMDVPWRIS